MPPPPAASAVRAGIPAVTQGSVLHRSAGRSLTESMGRRKPACRAPRESAVVRAIGEQGLLVLVGVTHHDTPQIAAKLATKLWGLRILKGEKSCSDVGAP